MPITTEIEVELARVDVADDYSVELTVRDALTGKPATAPLTWSQAQDLMDELQATIGAAVSAYWEDRGQPLVEHGFDVDVPPAPPCPECVAGKCRNCSGQTMTHDGDLVTCPCEHSGIGGGS